MKIKITNDVYDIASRLRELDPAYEVYFDTDLQKFTVWAFGLRQAILPYDELDIRSLEFVWSTRRENAEKLIREIDRDNERIEREERKRIKDEVENETSRRLRLSHL